MTYSAEAIVKAGGTVVQLPQVKDEAGAKAALTLVDGIIFSGGGDLDPAYYGQALLSGQPAMDIERISPDRDRSDLLLMNAAISADMPTLGICRGMQVMNVAAGGSLIQDIPLQVETAVVHRDPLRKVMVYHPISIKAGTQISAMLGSTELSVNSWHHQGILELGTGLTPTAWSSDGLIEAFEMVDRKYMIGVQFHPETLVKNGKMLYLEMFRELVRQAQ